MLLTDTVSPEFSRPCTDRVGLEAIAGPNILSKNYLVISCMHMIELTAEDSREVTLLRLQLKHVQAIMLNDIEVENEA